MMALEEMLLASPLLLANGHPSMIKQPSTPTKSLASGLLELRNNKLMEAQQLCW